MNAGATAGPAKRAERAERAAGDEVDRTGAAWWLCLTLCVLAIMVWLSPQSLSALTYDRQQLAQGQWWRLLSAHLTHLSGRHLLLNLAGTVLLCELFWRHLPVRPLAGLLLASAASVSVGLWLLMPELQAYAGLSGVLHGGWAGATVLLLWQNPRPDCLRRAWWALALLALGMKLCWEVLQGASPASSVIGGVVITFAHALGAAGGLAFAAVFLLVRYLGNR